MRKMVLFILTLLLTCFTVSSAFASIENDNTLNNHVSIDQAQLVGEKFILQSSDLSEWHSAKLVYSETFYDLDESELGYYFIVTEGNNQNGHIVISATKDRGPILQYSRNVLSLNNKEGGKGYYLGGLKIVYANSARDIAKVLNLKGIKTSSDLTLRSLKKSPEKSSLDWGIYLNENQNLMAAPYPTSKELSVTRVWQRAKGVNKPDSFRNKI